MYGMDRQQRLGHGLLWPNRDRTDRSEHSKETSRIIIAGIAQGEQSVSRLQLADANNHLVRPIQFQILLLAL